MELGEVDDVDVPFVLPFVVAVPLAAIVGEEGSELSEDGKS